MFPDDIARELNHFRNRAKSLEAFLVEEADAIDELIKCNALSHHPNVEMDAMTEGWRSVGKGKLLPEVKG